MAGGDLSRYFQKGADIEISSEDDGFRGSWYTGTIVTAAEGGRNKRVWVKYKTLMKREKGTKRLKEELLLVQIRPAQPAEERRKFEYGDDVDAWYNDGWWEGIVTEVNGEEDYTVFFKFSREQLRFKASGLRRHREWVYGKWIPSFEPVGDDAPSRTDQKSVSSPKGDDLGYDFSPESDDATQYNYRPGSSVEVSSDEDGFEGALIPATIVKEINKAKCLIEYDSLFSDSEGKKLLREEVSIYHLRPCPPDIGLVDRFEVLEPVDALYNDCWWVGVITKVLKEDRYSVYFKGADELLIFKHSGLRVHQDWINGKWIIPPKVQML